MSKKAVISTGGKQYIVQEGDSIEVELLKQEGKSITFEPLLTVDGSQISVGKPIISGKTVSAEITEQDVPQEKVTSIRYKAKKRVRKVRGHRQRKTTLKIVKII